MNAAETIQAAIVKLTAIRDENDFQIVNGWLVENTGSGSEYIGGMRLDDGRQPVTNDPMVVTLYATIDAQLAILNSAMNEFRGSHKLASHDEPNASESALDLAHAILGNQVTDD